MPARLAALNYSDHATQALGALAVALLVFTASLLGILTRPVGYLAAFWPANALLLGIMVRFPTLSSIWGWIGAFIGFIAADAITGGSLGITVWLTLANLSGAITGVLLFRLLRETDQRLGRPLSVLFLFLIVAASAVVAALVGGGAARLLFDRDFIAGIEFWFVTELVNGLIILPVVLSFPSSLENLGHRLRRIFSGWHVAPLGALAVSALVAVWVGGPGAVAFTVPALLWCALTYSVFVTSALTLIASSWMLVATSAGIVDVYIDYDYLSAASSVRLGIALIALGPLTVASINEARSELVARLAHAANHDSLTGALSRGAFMKRGAKMIGNPAAARRKLVVLMLDIDHFKQVNDRYGHATGDKVLAAFARTVKEVLRPDDIFGRLGGEEFALVLAGTTKLQATAIAERIRTEVETASSDTREFGAPITVSIGLADAQTHHKACFETLLSLADRALYQAKEQGRNRVELA